MPSFAQRSDQKELLDGVNIPFDDIRQNMQELDFINTWLGGHAITRKGLQKLVQGSQRHLHVVELGCGGGDNLRALKKWAAAKGYSIRLTGIDINQECIRFAQSLAANKGIHFICNDYQAVSFPGKPHVLFSSLFCHHFTNQQLVDMLQWMRANSTLGFFINDLHRHPLAYYSIRSLTRLFSKSYLVKNDAPLSVQRGFVRQEWEALLQRAGITQYSLTWQWAFRWLLMYRHD
jgi:2-polyprenyl-3-methyl-5-hydroxy-6-metoxy-1,4-benzoquinol methylase